MFKKNQKLHNKRQIMLTLRAIILSICLSAIFQPFASVARADDAPMSQVLPFKQTSLQTLRASSRKACATWHVWAISVDNKPASSDWYATHEMNPEGYSGQYFKAGGRMRERPLPRPVSTDPNWKIRDMEQDIRRAGDIGLDCFFFSLCTLGSGHCWEKMLTMLTAINNVDPSFKIVPMIDSPSINGKASAAAAATALASIADNPGLMRDEEGRLYISASSGDAQPVSWWKAFKEEMSKRGVAVSLIPIVQSYIQYKNDFLAISDGIGPWGAGTPTNASGTAERAAEVHAKNKLYISTVRPQVFRPKDMWYKEAVNSKTFRDMLTDAISGNADWIVFVSWNDRTEHTEISPSTGTQWGFFDLSAYYIEWLKTRQEPTITRDVLYYFHRIHWTTTPFNTNKQSKAFELKETAQPAVDQIEMLAFLKKPGWLDIKSENTGKTKGVEASAGVTSFTVPLASGKQRFRLFRDGTMQAVVLSPFVIRNTTTWQDLLYRSGSSTRTVVDMVANPAVTN